MSELLTLTSSVQGCAVTQRGAGANMSVDVAAGSVLANGVGAAVTATNVAIGAADATLDRVDAVVSDTAGAVSVIAGGYPESVEAPPPPDTTGYLLLGYVQVFNQAHADYTGTIVDGAITSVTTGPGQVVPAISGTAHLTADVTMTSANTFYDGPNTGAIGAAGQVLLLLAYADVIGGAAVSAVTVRITDGTTVFAEVSGGAGATNAAPFTLSAIVSPSAAATYKITAASTSAAGAIKADPTSNSSGAHVATRISYVRLA